MRSTGTHFLISLLIAFLVRGPVHAAPLRALPPAAYLTKGSTRLLVVVAPLDARAKALQGLVEHAAETQVDQSDRFDVMRGVDAFDGAAARARFDKAAEATNLSAQAKKALEDLDSAAATKLYAEAVAAWKQADLTKGIDGLVEAQVGKAAGHSVSEENPQAKQEIERALVLAPKLKLSDAQFPPELLKYAEAQRKAYKNAKGKLTVRTEPPGARIWVDGTYKGASPVIVEGLAPSEKHLVVAALAGWAMAAEEVSPGERILSLKGAEQSFQLQSAIDRIAKDPEGPGRDAAARELGKSAMADQVLLLVTKKGQSNDKLDVTGLRLDVKDGHNFAYQVGSLSALPVDQKSNGEWMTALLGLDAPRDGKDPVSHFAGGAGGGRGVSGKRIAGFALLGGALLAAASWGVFGYSALTQANLYKNTFQVQAPVSANAVRQGRTFALIADVSWAVGAVLLIAGVLLAFTPLFGGGGGKSGGGAKAQPEDPALKAYREQQEEQRRLEEERQRKAQEEQAQPPPPPEEQQPKPEEKKPEEKKPEEAPPPKSDSAPPPEEKKKKLTPAEERAEKKKREAEERAEKKRKAEEEKAEKKRKAEEEKQRLADEKKKAAEEKKRAEDEKKKKAEDEKRAAEGEKQRQADEEKRRKEEEQKAKDEAEAKKTDEERRKKEEEERKKREEEDARDKKQEPKKDKKPDEDDLRNF